MRLLISCEKNFKGVIVKCKLHRDTDFVENKYLRMKQPLS